MAPFTAPAPIDRGRLLTQPPLHGRDRNPLANDQSTRSSIHGAWFSSRRFIGGGRFRPINGAEERID